MAKSSTEAWRCIITKTPSCVCGRPNFCARKHLWVSFHPVWGDGRHRRLTDSTPQLGLLTPLQEPIATWELAWSWSRHFLFSSGLRTTCAAATVISIVLETFLGAVATLTVAHLPLLMGGSPWTITPVSTDEYGSYTGKTGDLDSRRACLICRPGRKSSLGFPVSFTQRHVGQE